MKEINIKGRTYIVKGDYPDGKYSKKLKVAEKIIVPVDIGKTSTQDLLKKILEILGVPCK